jgi:carbamoyltransferase
LGLLYSAFTYFTGFKVNSGEYKIMGLAPYGEPKYVQTIKDHLLQINEDGGFCEHDTSLPGQSDDDRRRVCEAVRRPRRKPESKLTQREMDLAR